MAREANGTVKAVQANGFTMTDASGRDLFFAVDNDTQIVARGAGTRMSQLRAGGKASPLSEFLAAKQTVSVKYLDSAGKLTAQEVQVR